VKKDCESINNSVICRTYGAVIKETDGSVLECVWVESNNKNESSDALVNGRCIQNVYVYISIHIFFY
jgi:hypothetical protein